MRLGCFQEPARRAAAPAADLTLDGNPVPITSGGSFWWERSRGSQMKVKPIQILDKSFPGKSETGPFGGPFPVSCKKAAAS